jgi:hypothetical protein
MNTDIRQTLLENGWIEHRGLWCKFSVNGLCNVFRSLESAYKHFLVDNNYESHQTDISFFTHLKSKKSAA